MPDGKEEPGIPYYGIRAFSGSCADFPVIKAENRSSVHNKEDVVLCETEEAELRDVDVPEQLIKWERDYGESGKSGEET